MTISTQAAAICDLATKIDTVDNEMKQHARELLFLMTKKEALTVCLKQLAKELK